jgi:hypothetical protein
MEEYTCVPSQLKGNNFDHPSIFVKRTDGKCFKMHYVEDQLWGSCFDYSSVPPQYKIVKDLGVYTCQTIQNAFDKLRSYHRMYDLKHYNCFHWANELCQLITGETKTFIKSPHVPGYAKFLKSVG